MNKERFCARKISESELRNACCPRGIEYRPVPHIVRRAGKGKSGRLPRPFRIRSKAARATRPSGPRPSPLPTGLNPPNPVLLPDYRPELSTYRQPHAAGAAPASWQSGSAPGRRLTARPTARAFRTARERRRRRRPASEARPRAAPLSRSRAQRESRRT